MPGLSQGSGQLVALGLRIEGCAALPRLSPPFLLSADSSVVGKCREFTFTRTVTLDSLAALPLEWGGKSTSNQRELLR
jgi:hypothetical protein